MNAVILENPKYPRNVGAIIRAASCFDIPQVLFTGGRVSLTPSKGYRLPREERMRGYKDVEITNSDKPIDRFSGQTIVAVELVPGSMPLTTFEHPDDAVYVFGPEDGSLSKGIKTMCHQFINIQSKHCLNLSAAVYVVLHDRQTKLQLAGLLPILPVDEMLGWNDDVDPDHYMEMGLYDGGDKSALASRTA